MERNDYRFIGDGYHQDGAKEVYKSFASRSSAYRYARKHNYETIEEYFCGSYVTLKGGKK